MLNHRLCINITETLPYPKAVMAHRRKRPRDTSCRRLRTCLDSRNVLRLLYDVSLGRLRVIDNPPVPLSIFAYYIRNHDKQHLVVNKYKSEHTVPLSWSRGVQYSSYKYCACDMPMYVERVAVRSNYISNILA